MVLEYVQTTGNNIVSKTTRIQALRCNGESCRYTRQALLVRFLLDRSSYRYRYHDGLARYVHLRHSRIARTYLLQ